MTAETTGSDVLQAAMQMERVGKDFYEALALGSDDARVRQFCIRAAAEETKHLATFQQMHQQWTRPSSHQRPSEETVESLSALAKGRIQPDPVAVRKVAVGGNLKEALDMALAMEQDAINFYQELLARLPQSAQALQWIIGEEKRHVSTLRMLAG